MKELLSDAATRAARYLSEVNRRTVAPLAESVALLGNLGGPLPDGPTDPAALLALLDEVGSPATVATTGGRYFGFVIGGTEVPRRFAFDIDEPYELGGSNASPCHLDIPLHGYSLYLDDRQIVDRGQIVVPEMKPRS